MKYTGMYILQESITSKEFQHYKLYLAIDTTI